MLIYSLIILLLYASQETRIGCLTNHQKVVANNH
jgi:hypothetical protein